LIRINLLNCLRNSKATDHNSHKIITQRKDLQQDIKLFHANVPFLLDDSLSPHSPYTMPEDDLDDDSVHNNSSGFVEGEDDADDDQDSDDEDAPLGSHPETAYLPLPSHLGRDHFKNPLIAALAADEVQLRIDQASEALQQLRLSLGLKSALFRSSVSVAKSQYTKTRAWRAINAVDVSVRRHAQQYRNAHQALLLLGASSSVMAKFPVLKKEDLKLSRDIVEENRLGQKSEHVTWIWRVEGQSMIGEDEWLTESE
jgi:hypothetical protein